MRRPGTRGLCLAGLVVGATLALLLREPAGSGRPPVPEVLPKKVTVRVPTLKSAAPRGPAAAAPKAEGVIDLRVRARGPAGESVSGALVFLLAPREVEATARRTWADEVDSGKGDAEGVCAFRVAAEHTELDIAVMAPGYAPASQRWRRGAQRQHEVAVTLRERGGRIAGRVITTDGHPVSAAMVVARASRWGGEEGLLALDVRLASPVAFTGADGSFELAVDEQQVYAVSAYADDHVPAPLERTSKPDARPSLTDRGVVQASAGTNGITLRVAAVALACYRYVDAETGKPIDHRPIEEQWVGEGLRTDLGDRRRAVRAEGRIFDLDGLRRSLQERHAYVQLIYKMDSRATDAIQLFAGVGGFRRAQARVVLMPLRALADPLAAVTLSEIPLTDASHGDRVTATVRFRTEVTLDCVGSGPPTLFVRIGKRVEAIAGTPDGTTARFGGVPTGGTIERVGDGTRYSNEMDVVVPGNDFTLDVDMPAFTGISVIAHDAGSGDRIHGARAGVIRGDGRGRWVAVAANAPDGRTYFALAPGTHNVFVAAPGYKSSVMSVTLKKGEAVALAPKLAPAE